MAFDTDTRNKLSKMVADARALLKNEFTQQLQELYGIQPDGKITALEKLVHLDDEQHDIARVLRERVAYISGSLSGGKKQVKVAVDRMTREQSFTVLNRFTALRMCEERGLLQQCVGGGLQSKGFQVYLKTAGSSLGGQYERFRTFIFSIFDEIAIDLGILFDRFSPFGLLFPREAALGELLEIINREELKYIWAEDEAIGWIYQYFNSSEERKAMRKATAAPRNSRELAVRNQFFTPRYVVEFLTDNTLGRIWYEMRQGYTSLKDNCRYLVRRPNEVFLETGQEPPEEDESSNKNLSQEELLNKTTYIPFRAKKDPRDLKILDPACGSGHFLLYAFDLLETIYEEAWQDEDSPLSDATGHTLCEDFESLDELRKAIPELILRWNLYGIDIDPRAVQIAALALWLQTQRLWQTRGVRSAERPRLTKSNIVCAEPMPGDDNMLKEFVNGLQPKVLSQLVEVVFEKMKLAGEAGSLLKIEEEIKDAVAEARKQWEAKPKPEQARLFPEIDRPKYKQQELRFDVSDIDDAKFWDRAESLILQFLQGYAELSENGSENRRRMFAEDAAQGFGFIDLCRKRFDVVLMNPPFGEASAMLSSYCRMKYPMWNKNLLCSFFDRMLSISSIVGSVFDRTASIKTTYQDFRRSVILTKGSLQTVADLGWNVLDADVEVSAAIISSPQIPSTELFFDVLREHVDSKADKLLEACGAAAYGRLQEHLFYSKPKSFLKLPNAVLGFQFPWFVRRLFELEEPLTEKGCRSFKGHDFKADQHFMLFWEIPFGFPGAMGSSAWSWVFNGGDWLPYYHPTKYVAPYGEEGSLLKDHPNVLLRNVASQGKPGVGYGKRGQFLDAQIIGSGHAYTAEGIGAVVKSEDDAFFFASLLNSRLFQFIINLYCGQHKSTSYVNLFPVPSISQNEYNKIIQNSQLIWKLKQAWQARNETDIIFMRPHLLSVKGDSIKEKILHLLNDETKFDQQIKELTEYNNQLFFDLYKLKSEDIGLVNEYCASMPEDRVWSEGPINNKAYKYVNALFSSFLGCIYGRWNINLFFERKNSDSFPEPFDQPPSCPIGILKNEKGLPAEARDVPADYPLPVNWSGILVDDEGDIKDIVSRIREAIEVIWNDNAENIEQEACEIIGVKSLREYFSKPNNFFSDHLKRYSKGRRKAPIYWPLSTKSGSYTLWLYYNRLTDQTLFTCVNDFVNPKIDTISKDIERLQKELSESGDAEKRAELEKLQDFRQELTDFHDEMLRIAKLPYKPDLNDGVIITASPLWKLFRLKKWQNDLKSCWEKLETGEYDWAHLAYSIWPDRVREKCKTDRSIAIAHDLEHLCEIEPKKTKV